VEFFPKLSFSEIACNQLYQKSGEKKKACVNVLPCCICNYSSNKKNGNFTLELSLDFALWISMLLLNVCAVNFLQRRKCYYDSVTYLAIDVQFFAILESIDVAIRVGWLRSWLLPAWKWFPLFPISEQNYFSMQDFVRQTEEFRKTKLRLSWLIFTSPDQAMKCFDRSTCL